VPAALVTSAARSASQLLSQTPDVTVSQWMETLNQAIYGTLQGEIQMTFFLGCLDQDTGIFSFANASHDPPYWFAYQSEDEKLDRKSVEPLIGESGRRLGEEPDSKYQEVSIQLKPGQVISFLTDGVIDVMNAEQKTYGDRRLLKNLVGSLNESRDTKRAAMALQNELESFRQQTPLNDDVTFFFVEYHG
jgi:sigma-B regulation protein RsbU (phosphoserine phosphatase)